MKTPRLRPQNLGITLALSLCLCNQALAAASYSSSVDLSYSISVADSSNPASGDTSGLSILGTFLQPTDADSFYANSTGDGVYQAVSPNPAATAVSSVFNGSFSVSGSAGLGTVDSLHTGLFGLELSNSGPYSYNMSVSFNYALQALSQGEFASSSILFDYWDDAGVISGSNYASAASYTGNLNDQQSAADAVTWNFTLAAGATEQLYAQAGIESHLQSADAAAVPLPGAIWLFAGALAGMGWLGRRKQDHHQQ